MIFQKILFFDNFCVFLQISEIRAPAIPLLHAQGYTIYNGISKSRILKQNPTIFPFFFELPAGGALFPSQSHFEDMFYVSSAKFIFWGG